MVSLFQDSVIYNKVFRNDIADISNLYIYIFFLNQTLVQLVIEKAFMRKILHKNKVETSILCGIF